jgi:predicted nucleic acid-binding Zn ribbon protein
MTRPTDLLKRQADSLLRDADRGTTARKRGYSHGELPGAPPGVDEVHLTQEHWQNVGRQQHGELGDEERDEERRAEGAYSDQRADGDIVVTIRFRGVDPRSWLNGWDEAAKAAYLARPREGAEWNDQAWNRYLARKRRMLPDMMACVVCGETFQPERRTARYCSEACSSKAARQRRKRQANSAVA